MQHSLRQLAAYFVLVVTILCAMPVVAEYVEPGNVSIATEPYFPVVKDFATGVYKYDIEWQGIPVANASVTVRRGKVDEKDYFLVRADAKTVSAVRLFYRMNHRSEAMFRAEDFTPFTFYSRQVERRRQKYRQVYFEENGTIRFTSWKDGRHQHDKEFLSGNTTLDPLSAAFLARSLPLQVGTKKAFDVFNGKHRYLIEFKVTGLDILNTKQGKRSAFRVVPQVKKLTDTDTREKRLKSATIWISADSRRDILKLESSVLVGSVSAELDTFHRQTLSDAQWRQSIQALLDIAPGRVSTASTGGSAAS